MKLGLFIAGRKGSAQEPTSYPVYLLSNLPLAFIFHNGCVFGHVLESTERNEKKTWFIDRNQREEGMCVITTIHPFILRSFLP